MTSPTSELRRRAALPWAAPILAGLRERVAAAVACGPRIPAADAISGWAHNFTCSRCAARLPFSWDMPGPFTCAACGKVDDGEDRREAWIYFANLRLIDDARDASVLAQCEDAPAALAFARAVLLGYARRYLEWPVHGRWAGKGRVQPQSLCEAVWMLPACEVFDRLGWLGALSEAERAEVRERMFAPAIALLRPQTHDVHNIQVWLAAALLALAERCGDAETSGFARGHLQHNAERGVLPDGSWYECSPHYHFYACEAFLGAVDACHRLGTEAPAAQTLRRMLRAPLPLLRPDGQFALLNDGWPENPLVGRAAFYEHADGLLGGCGDVLAAIYARGAARDSLQALLYGPEALPDRPLVLPALAACDGIVTVRRGGLLALIKANPDGGGHDHRDEPALDLHLLDGGLDAGDLGNPGYGNPLHGAWFKRTAAHNTVLVDGQDHAADVPVVVEAGDRGACSVVRVHASRALPGGTLLRTVVVGDGWVLDHVIVGLAQPGELLWRFHAKAAFACAAPARDGAFLANPHVTAQRELQAEAWLDGLWTAPAGGRLAVRVWRPLGEAARFGAASAPALPATEHIDLVCAAVRGTRGVFTACFAVGALPEIASTAVAGGTRYTIAGTTVVLADDGKVATP
jgi:hypothetical protein